MWVQPLTVCVVSDNCDVALQHRQVKHLQLRLQVLEVNVSCEAGLGCLMPHAIGVLGKAWVGS